MKVLVTGGAGYIGSHAVCELINQNYEVIVVDSLITGFTTNLHPEAKYYRADLRDYETLKTIFETEKNIVAIMHFAGSIVVSESVIKPLEYFDNNFNGVKVLLDLANQFNIKHFIFSSTAAVYGEPEEIPINENNLTKPINPYGSSKLAAEWLIQAWAKANPTNYVIFRYFNVAGAHQNGLIGVKNERLTHLVPVILDAAINNKSINIYGNDYATKDGTCIRDFLHVEDLVKAHIIGLEWTLKNNQSEIFNLGSGHGYSVLEVCNAAKEVLQMDLKVNFNNRRSGDPAILLANIEKAEKILNWKPEKTLAEIIQSEFNFRKKFNTK